MMSIKFTFPTVRTLSLLVPYFVALSIRLALDHPRLK